MANFKRKKPRASTVPHGGRRDWGSLHAPKVWDILRHTRPRRREQTRLLADLVTGRSDPDAIAWPLGNHKPHVYYW